MRTAEEAKVYYYANHERCKAYRRKQYQTYKVQRLEKNRERRAKLQEKVNYFKLKPCMDCKHTFNVHCMEFDHRDPSLKCFSIATAVAQCYAWEKIRL